MQASLLTLLACAVTGVALAATPAAPAKLVVSSSAFAAGGPIPEDLTCHGANTSPQLAWTSPPEGTKSLAVLADDPDAPHGTVLHWLVTGIAPTAAGLVAGGPLPDGAVAARNQRGRFGYMGPCPPAGATHHYRFHVYALDVVPPRPASAAAFRAAIRGHVLGEGELVGVYHGK